MKPLAHLTCALGTAWLGLSEGLRLSPEPEGEPGRILVIGYAAIGDLIFFLPVLEALRRRHPQAKITFIANRYPTTEDLLPATGLVDDIWFVDWEGPGARAERGPINRRIAQAGFDLALLSLSSPAHFYQRGLSSIPVRVGHCRQMAGGTWARFKRGLITGEFTRRALLNRPVWLGMETEHALQRNLRLLPALGIEIPMSLPRPRLPISAAQRERAAEILGKPDKTRIGVHLGAPNNQYGKMWEPENFGKLCMALSQATPKLEFVLLGSAEEEESARSALKIFPQFKSLVGKCSLLETFAALETCGLFLSNDTGLAKAGMVLGVPTATWWGPSNPLEYGVVWDGDRHLDIRTEIACSPCSRMGMPREGMLNYTNCGHHNCLKALDVEFALKALRRKYSALIE